MGPRVPAEPGALLAAGRACDVFEYGENAVLRRYREGGDPEREAAVMRRAEAAGVRVPRVLEVHPDALVLERIEGPTMLEEIERQPWRFVSRARQLGRLHRELLASGLVHMDFHPLNVMLAPDGPVVIDWSNAHEGEAEADVAFTQVILATSESDFPRWLEWLGRVLRTRFVAAYLSGVDLKPGPERLAAAADIRRLDPHLRERELASVERFRGRL
jgi:tRNA A-37 threonylcarbamoyl transferase component Bud32